MASVLRLAFILLVVVVVVYDAVESRGLRSDYKTHSLFRQHLLKQRGVISKVRSLFGRHSETTHKPEPPVAHNTPGNDIIPGADKPSEETPGDSDETPEENNAATERPEGNDDTPENAPEEDNASTERPEENDDTPENAPEEDNESTERPEENDTPENPPEEDNASTEKPEENDDTPENAPEEDNASTERPEENDDTPENTPSIDVEANTPDDDVVVVVGSTKPPCDEELFTCGNGECALQSWLCDGDDDCGDGSDEAGCEPRTCPSGSFACANHRCINAAYVCDGDNDCGDGSDETGCEERTCPPGSFTCANRRCINGAFVCDGDNDCGDRSDEVNCTGGPGPGPGPVPTGRCPDGFFPFGNNPRQCLQPVLYDLQWQAAADFCSALHPKAHLQVIDTPAQLSGLQELFGHAANDLFISQSCPKWWTAGRRVDDSVADSPIVWDVCSGRSSTQEVENCLSTSNLNSYWPSRGGPDFAEGQPACVAFTIGIRGLPWSAVSCKSHACSMCTFTL